jgi:hypothetical protein
MKMRNQESRMTKEHALQFTQINTVSLLYRENGINGTKIHPKLELSKRIWRILYRRV